MISAGYALYLVPAPRNHADPCAERALHPRQRAARVLCLLHAAVRTTASAFCCALPGRTERLTKRAGLCCLPCFLPCVRNLRMPWYTGLVWLGLRTGLRSPTPPNTYLSVVVPAPGSVSCCLCLSGSAAAALTSYVKRKPYGTGLCRSDPAADRHSHQVTIECKSHRSTLSCILHPWRLRGVLREHRPPGPAPIIMPVYIYSTTVASST